MNTWFPPRWACGGSAYVGAVLLLATYALTGDHLGAYLLLLCATCPTSFVLLVPIYLTMSLVDAALGAGLQGSPASLTVGIAGFVVAAAINLLIIRFVTLGLRTVGSELKWACGDRSRS